jgi:aldose 1-epimerase
VLASTQVAPSGEQFELQLGQQRVVIVEVGGGLRVYEVAGRALLDSYDVDAMAGDGRGQVLIPWPNRIEDGTYEFGGKQHRLALTEPSARNAIHGLVRWQAWSVAEREAERVVLEHTLHAQPGYPFTLDLALEYALSNAGLRVTTTATNTGSSPCPYGSGCHPYLTLGTDTVDPLVLRAPGATVLQTDERGIPVSSTPVDDEYDFREPRAIGTTKLDHAFTDLERGDDDLARVELHDPESGNGVTVWLDESHAFVQLFTGDPLPGVNRRSIAVEPMTCAPNAFRTSGALTLAPGETTTSTWGIEPMSAP